MSKNQRIKGIFLDRINAFLLIGMLLAGFSACQHATDAGQRSDIDFPHKVVLTLQQEHWMEGDSVIFDVESSSNSTRIEPSSPQVMVPGPTRVEVLRGISANKTRISWDTDSLESVEPSRRFVNVKGFFRDSEMGIYIIVEESYRIVRDNDDSYYLKRDAALQKIDTMKID
jgi:hypothetical protein